MRCITAYIALLVTTAALAIGTHPADAQTITLFPNQVPNGISSGQGERYHQRFDVTFDPGATEQTRAFTVDVPSELVVSSSSVTAVANATNFRVYYAGSPSADQLAFGVTRTSATLNGRSFTIEFDVTTPSDFTHGTGVQDTAYVFDFATGAGQTDTDVSVAKHGNTPVRTVAFAAPDSTLGDATTGGGRYYKLAFPSSFPDPLHTGLTGLSATATTTDAQTDVLYSFYISTNASAVTWSGEPKLSFYSLMSDGGGGGPLLGSRQVPRPIPATFVREDFRTTFAAAGRDSINGLVSLANTQSGGRYYIYVLADVAPGRTGYDPTATGALSGSVFLGRSGPLDITHPPEFVIGGWDYDDDPGDSFDDTGVVQVPSDIVGMEPGDANRKDNRDITLDTGLWYNKGPVFAGVNGGVAPDPASSVDLLFLVQDSEVNGTFAMNIFLSADPNLTAAGLSADVSTLTGATAIPGANALNINNKSFTFAPDTTFADTTYYVYYAAKDDDGKTLSLVLDDPFDTTPSPARLNIEHSPQLEVDTFSLNDYDGSGDGDLDVVTGIDVSQLIADGDGQFANPVGPATRFVTISWGGQGVDGDKDLDDDATIEFYYSTRSDFKDSRGSVANTSTNSDGTDLTNAISDGDNDTHLIGSTTEDPDGRYDNQFTWDLWSYVSAQSTVPMTGVRYYLYALLKGGNATRLFSLTRSGSLDQNGTSMALNFLHPPYIQAVEPARDISVTVDEPVLVSWNAVDVDNGESGGRTAVPAGTSGKQAPNSRTASPNVRVLLTSADFGEVTTWGSVTNSAQTQRFWVGNSGDGSLQSEIELNEGVDTSFVIVGNRLRNNLFSTSGLGGASGGLELQTNAGAGQTYFVYVGIDDGRDGSVADAVDAGTPQETNFGAYSPLVRAPGTVTFTGTVPANPPTANRFIIPAEIKTAVDEAVKVPIIPDVLVSGTNVASVSIFMSVDTTHFEAIDQDSGTAGIQPFTLGENSGINPANVNQGSYVQGGQLRMEFIYTDYVTGLNFFDGTQPLAIANLRARPLTSGNLLATTIGLDKTGSRETKMRDNLGNKIAAALPADINIEVRRRANITVEVPLEGRSTTSSDTMTFFLRQPGSYATISDSLFGTQDIDTSADGIQKKPSDAAADEYALTNVPSGRYVLTAYIYRHLAGQDTVVVETGSDPANVKPTRDGAGIQRNELLAGDASGFTDTQGNQYPDNFVNDVDINFINNALFTQPTDPGWEPFADINRDDIVNATDFDYANVNQTDLTGAPGKIKPVFPTFKLLADDATNADAVVTFAGLPESEIRPGEVFELTVKVSGARAVRTYEVHMAYDPTKLVVEEAPTSGDLLTGYLTNLGGKIGGGEVGLVNSIIGRTPVGASGEGTLATVRFRAISRSSETVVKLSDALLIDVEHTGMKPKVSGEARIVLSKDPIAYHDAAGEEIRGLILADTDPTVDFNDFMVFVKAFGTSWGEAGYDLMADLNGDDKVNFADFLIFTQDFGKEAVDAPSATRASKAVVLEGSNRDARVSLNVTGDARMGEMLTLTADLSEAASVQGWGLTVKFDPQEYEFVDAVAPQENLLTTQGGSTPVFLVHQGGEGQVSVANAVGQGAAGSGEGVLAVLRFRPKGEFEQGRFEIFDGILFDANQLSNGVYADAALEVRMVPTEFALAQNYPNPFNPETTITYDLAEGTAVRLDVYNVMGQLVHTLVNEQQAAGRYRVVWNGMDAGSRQVASGVYFYRIQTQGFNAVRKLLLLK